MGAILLRILVGVLIMGAGILMTWKTVWIHGLLGPVGFAEKAFGGGGSKFFYKLVGIAVVFIGIIVATNLFDRIFGGLILRVFGG